MISPAHGALRPAKCRCQPTATAAPARPWTVSRSRAASIGAGILLGLMVAVVAGRVDARASADCVDCEPAERGSSATDYGRMGDERRAAIDRDLRQAVRDLLRDKDNVAVSGLKIEVDRGVVTLHGVVGTAAEKHLASRYVQDVVGVQGVVNALIVDAGLQR